MHTNTLPSGGVSEVVKCIFTVQTFCRLQNKLHIFMWIDVPITLYLLSATQLIPKKFALHIQDDSTLWIANLKSQIIILVT